MPFDLWANDEQGQVPLSNAAEAIDDSSSTVTSAKHGNPTATRLLLCLLVTDDRSDVED